jgi:transposase
LKENLPPPSLDGLEAILVDENAIRCGELFATFVINARTGELLSQGEGKRSATLTAFFAQLTPAQKSSITAVCSDRSGAFKDAITTALPHAAIVYDKFHLLANDHAVLDQVRRDAWHAADPDAKKFITVQRDNLFRNVENLRPELLLELDAVLRANADISAAYILRDQFTSIWSFPTPEGMRSALNQWRELAAQSGVAAVMRFAKNRIKSAKEMVAYAVHKITNGPMEGLKNLVSRVIQRGNGVRSLPYVFLHLRAETLPTPVCGVK